MNRIMMLCGFLLALAVTAGIVQARDWPQLQGNPQRTGYTPDTVKPPLKVSWKHSFLPERVCRFTQAVTFSGKVFVGTESGNLYALSATDGKEAWKFACGSPITHTTACAAGKVVAARNQGNCGTCSRRRSPKSSRPATLRRCFLPSMST